MADEKDSAVNIGADEGVAGPQKTCERFILSGGLAEITVKREIAKREERTANGASSVPRPFRRRRGVWPPLPPPSHSTPWGLSYVRRAYHKFNMPSRKAI